MQLNDSLFTIRILVKLYCYNYYAEAYNTGINKYF